MGPNIPERRKIMETSKKTLGRRIVDVIIVLAPLAGGLVSSRIAGDQMSNFGDMVKPPLAPPAWLFPIAWTILYLLMGLALLYLIRSNSKYREGAVALFVSQLLMNYIWSPVFFNMEEYWLAFGILITMWLTTIITAIVSYFVDRRAVLCLIPLILWTTFAAYLNAGIAILN